MHVFLGLRSAGKLIRLLVEWEYCLRSEKRPFPQTVRFKIVPVVQNADSKSYRATSVVYDATYSQHIEMHSMWYINFINIYVGNFIYNVVS